MTELTEGQSLSRIIKVYGVEGPVIVTIKPDGIAFRVKGTKKTIFAAWTATVNACSTEIDVPSFLMNKPMDLLKHSAAKVVATKVKNATKESK